MKTTKKMQKITKSRPHTIFQDKLLGSLSQVPLLIFVGRIGVGLLVVAEIMKDFFVRGQFSHFITDNWRSKGK
jgi:hypothetical protein